MSVTSTPPARSALRPPTAAQPRRGARDPAHRHRVADHHRARLGAPSSRRRRSASACVLFSIYWLWKSLSFASGVAHRLLAPAPRPEARLARRLGAALPGFDELHHLVIVPTCGESEEILADTLHYLTLQDVPLERVSVVLAFEERDPMAPARAQRLSARFALAVRALPDHLPPRPAGRGQGQVVQPDLGRAARRGRADRHRRARSRTADRDRLRRRLAPASPLPGRAGARRALRTRTAACTSSSRPSCSMPITGG